mmetsp:Transcript_8112/g.9705  ORF Transcript_8112/g.9705 Transcript_8112/m.9705 type:complete len:240 (-) Transcript_8112:379-1098(-)
MSLGYLSQLHQLREMVDLCTDSEVVICELMRPRLQSLAPTSDITRDLVVLGLESVELLAEFGSFAAALDFDLSRQGLELIDVPRAHLLLNRQQLQIELVLIRLRQERNEESARFQHLGTQACIQEALVVLLSFEELSCVEFFFALVGGKGRNDDLREHLEEVVTQDLEVRIQALDAPFHGERVYRNHHARLLRQACQLRRDVLVDARDQTHAAVVTSQSGVLCNTSHSTAQNRVRSATL